MGGIYNSNHWPTCASPALKRVQLNLHALVCVDLFHSVTHLYFEED